MPQKEAPEIRFWKYAEPIPFAECWEWLGTRAKSGYGVLRVFGNTRLAHRISFELNIGTIPKGMFIDHKCRNRACVNPSHLRAVTPAQNNVENSISNGALNKIKTECKRGHPFNKKNTYFRKGGERMCRVCACIYQRERNKPG